MNFPTTAALATSEPNKRTVELAHDLLPLAKVQRRLAGRVAMVPVVELSAYRFRAVIDWIEFRVHLARSTQVQHLQQVLRRHLDRDSHIEPESSAAGNTFAACTIRVQEPASLAVVATLHQDIVDTFGEAAGSRVTAIEISVDAYPRQPADEARWTLLGALQRTIWTGRDIWSNPDSRPRRFGANRKLEKLIPPSREEALKKKLKHDDELLNAIVPEHHLPPVIDGTMYIGAKGDEVMIRIMDKVKDKQHPDGTFDALTDQQKRTRIEVALKGIELPALGITDVPSLPRMKITSIKKRYFQFRLPTFSHRSVISSGADVMRNTKKVWCARTYLRSGIVGLMAMDAASDAFRRAELPRVRPTLKMLTPRMPRIWGGTRLAADFVSWEELNQKVDVAFRQLEKRERTAWAGR